MLHAYTANFQKIERNIAFWNRAGLDWQQANQNLDLLLAEWSSAGDDLWRVTLPIADSSNKAIAGAVADTHVMQLDNTAPQATLVIDNNGDCSRYKSAARQRHRKPKRVLNLKIDFRPVPR